MQLRLALLALPLIACSTDTNDVTIDLAPQVISSLDGSLGVHAEVLADRDPTSGKTVAISVDYKDRNGNAHTIAPVTGKTDQTGALDVTLTGLTWDGTGTVTAQVLSGGDGSAPKMVHGQPLETSATFAVLDRTPPTIAIQPPANNQIHRATDTTIQVHVQDEIGVSQVYFEASGNALTNGGGGNGTRARSTVVASGTTDAMVSFDIVTSDTATVGSTITLYALASDLSGNQAAAAQVTLTVVQ